MTSGDILEVKGGLVGNRVRGLVFGCVNNNVLICKIFFFQMNMNKQVTNTN